MLSDSCRGVGMSRELHGGRDQIYIFPPSVDDWVPADHPVRFIDAFVDALDLSSLGSREESVGVTGRPHYGASVLLKIWLYGYVKGLRSTRKLEEACVEHLPFVWLAGQLRPDHNTLWRFFRRHRSALRKLSGQVIRVAANSGLIGLVLHAVDGTKIEARCSGRTGLHREKLEEELKQLDDRIGAWLEAIESSQERQHEDDENDDTGHLPPDLREAEALRSHIQRQLQLLKEADRSHLHPDEPECQMMQCDGRSRFAYNAQAVVDESSGLIVGEDVTCSGSDNHQLVVMLDHVQEVLGETASDTVADGGYASGETAGAVAALGYRATFSVDANAGRRSSDPFHASHFEYLPEQDRLRCPQSALLEGTGDWKQWKNKSCRVRRYQCRCFRECPSRWKCSSDPKGRRVLISEHVVALACMRARATSQEGKTRLRRRKAIVEPIFGWAKEVLHFRRWTFRGLDSVKAQWSLMCIALNLRKLCAAWQAGSLTPAI